MVLPIGLDANGRLVEIPSGSNLLPLGLDASGRFVEISAGGTIPRIGIGDNGQLIELASASVQRSWLMSDLPAEQAPFVTLDAKNAATLTFTSGNTVNKWSSSVGTAFLDAQGALYYDAVAQFTDQPGVYTFAAGRRLFENLAYPLGAAPMWIAYVGKAAPNKNNSRDVCFVGDTSSGTATLGANKSGCVYIRTKNGIEFETDMLLSDTYHVVVVQFGNDGQQIDFDGGTKLATAKLPETRLANLAGIGGSGDWESWHQHITMGRGVLSADNLARVQGLLADRFALQARYPATHPYKTKAPTVSA